MNAPVRLASRRSQPDLGSLLDDAIAAMQAFVQSLEAARRDLPVQQPEPLPAPLAGPWKTEDVAARLGISYSTLMLMVNKGEIGSVKAGRRYLIPEDAITRYLSAAVKGGAA